MNKYYRHYKGGLYCLLCIGKNSESHEEMVVYQALYGDRQIWIRPKEMFDSKVECDGKMMNRFEEIGEDAIPLEMSPRYFFPNIEYTNQKLPLTLGEFSKGVRRMITLMQNHQIVSPNFFQGLQNDDDIEDEALHRIQSFKEGDDIESIFHLIQAWGGISGRGIYVRGNGFDWSTLEPAYKDLVRVCLSFHCITSISIAQLVSAVKRFNKDVQNMGVSFITKHTRFWLHKSLGEDNALPIYDSIMARYVMNKEEALSKDLAEYWTVMEKKARSLRVGLVPFERQLFRFFYYSRLTDYSDGK